jgi:hypothetical protein
MFTCPLSVKDRFRDTGIFTYCGERLRDVSLLEANEKHLLKMKISQALWLMPVILATWEAKIRRLTVRPTQANSSKDPVSKITREKWTASVAQLIEHPLCKHRVLSSNPSPTPLKKKKRKKKKISMYYYSNNLLLH